ncbi:MAG: hypothetical protein KBS74_00525 [Clostridiales bacterium]|nr:hypothetical protein [Candidatus Cacconaster stercorequi]
MEPIKRLCPVCRDTELQFYKRMRLTGEGEDFLTGPEWLLVDVYLCPRCRRIELYAPMTPLEEFEATPEFHSDVEKFEWNFKDYSDKKLQKVIDGKDYVDDAKRAAKNLLMRRKYGEH